MEQLFTIASLWLALAVVSALIAYHIRISTALVEICVGVATAAVLAWLGYADLLGANLLPPDQPGQLPEGLDHLVPGPGRAEIDDPRDRLPIHLCNLPRGSLHGIERR